jgi:putative transposase
VRDWAHSSFHRYVKEGVLPADWAGNADEEAPLEFGERR